MVPIEMAALNLGIALSCGAVIGSERQVRQRMAGLRTNALVALGAAAFVIFSQLVPNEVSPTRVAAQVVSGIGFLGAGIIFRDGFNVHGLNTAATLWCAAAVGLVAGIGAWEYALLLTAGVVFVNLGLRPLVKFLKKHTKAGVQIGRAFRVDLTCAAAEEAAMRALLLRHLPLHGLHLSELSATMGEGEVTLGAVVQGEGVTDAAMEQAIARLGAEPGIRRLRWVAVDEV
ncbi:MgtC/SapB family protein [Tabrizicola oligotrophica]|uniref:Protein MgtC n=1 Tax=Tabrizicola oligotrophica TaxID=2710650 RepID=A0A6M0QPT8_9RHOB|nr:MgtC/SapB family protein [Tabrizicola oligotrophica]NEY89151.1 MgtC/SapB family protein [Tabrizicola oligotrophica]